jgi:adenylylsulfate kinase
MKIILIMGLPGSGKTTLANELAPLLNAKRLNADEVRKEANDWDFSEEGRKRQSKRMADFAIKLKNEGNFVVADFICPTPEARSYFLQIILFGLILLKKEGLMIQIKCLLNRISLTFM